MKRRSPSVNPMLRMCVVVVVPLTTLLFRRHWRGTDHVPAAGPAIVAVNHISYADPFVMARYVWDSGRVPRFLAKSTLFDVRVIGTILRRTGQIPVRRGTRDAAHALSDAVAALDRGEVVVIYPEGTVPRDPDFWPMTAKTGLARLWLQRPDTPVIPVGQWGAQDAIDFYRRRFRLLPPKAVRVSAGEAVDLTPFRERPATPETLRSITDTVMSAVRDEVGALRGRPVPDTFTPRPPGTGSSQDSL